MAKVVIEVFNDHGVRQDYRVFDAGLISIGRGYVNDIIIHDPYVSSQHVLVRLSPQLWTVEDLGTKNGTWLDEKKRIEGPCPIQSGDEIIIGKTRIRIFASTHKVPSSLRLAESGVFLQEISRPRKAWLITCTMLAVYAVNQHLESYKDLPAERFIATAFGILLTVLAGAGFWAFIGRVIKHRFYFNAQLAVLSLFLLVTELVYPAAGYIGYIFNSPFLESIFFGLIIGGFSWTLLVWNLALATHLPPRVRVVSSGIIVGTLMLFVLSAHFASQPEFDPTPRYYGVIKPPLAKLAPHRSIEQYIKKSEEIFNLDQESLLNQRFFEIVPKGK